MDAKDEKLADDLLFGARPIADFIGLTERQVYHQQRALGLRRLGAILVGSKSKLRRLLAGDEVEPKAATASRRGASTEAHT